MIERLDSKKFNTRYQVVELLHYLVRDGPIEWQETMVQNMELIVEWIKKSATEDTSYLLEKIQEWVVLKAGGPFAEGYQRVLKLLAEILPQVEVTIAPCDDLTLSRMRIAQEISTHCDLVTTTAELFVETLNFNQGYIGNNDLARDLHSRCKELKITNDKWLQRTDLNEALTVLLLASSDVLTNAFTTFADIVTQSNLIKAKEDLEEAQRKLEEAQRQQEAQKAAQLAAQKAQNPFNVAQFAQQGSSNQFIAPESQYRGFDQQSNMGPSTGVSSPYNYSSNYYATPTNTQPVTQQYQEYVPQSAFGADTFAPPKPVNPFESFEPAYHTLQQPNPEYSSLSRGPFQNQARNNMPDTYPSMTTNAQYSSLQPQRSNTNPFLNMPDQKPQ